MMNSISSRIRNSALVCLFLLAAFFVGCVTTGPGGDKSLILVGTDQEVAIGQEMNQQVRAESKILDDPEWQAYVNRIGQSIVKVCDRKDIEYQFGVIESPDINAFAAPGGYIYFYTGLLSIMDDESQLAAVMAHEISHVVARHGMKQLQRALIAQMGYEFVFGQQNGEEFKKVAAQIGLSLLFSDYSRDAEREADEFGIYYMVQAGYDPNGAIEMFQHLAEAGSRGSNVFENLLASHPQTQERIENARQQIQGMQNLPPNLRSGDADYQKMKARLPKSATSTN